MAHVLIGEPVSTLRVKPEAGFAKIRARRAAKSRGFTASIWVVRSLAGSKACPGARFAVPGAAGTRGRAATCNLAGRSTQRTRDRLLAIGVHAPQPSAHIRSPDG